MRSIRCGGILTALLLVWDCGAASAGPPLPFTLAWTKGVCRNCKVANSLSEVQFVAPDEAWAIGYLPPGETGAGDYSVLHSRDGGKTWDEIPEPWQHNGAPSLSFANSRDGWLKVMDLTRAEDRLKYTRDGGRHWRQFFALHDMFFSNVQYLGDGVGFAVDDNVYTPPSRLFSTRDDGRHWSMSLLPKGFSPGLMHFVSNRQGVIVGCLDKRVTVIRTEDSGAHWTSRTLDLPRQSPKEEYCIYEADSLDFVDAEHGWIVVSKHLFALNDRQYYAEAWATADGGASWKPIFHASNSLGKDDFFGGVSFLDDRVGVLGFQWNEKPAPGGNVGVLLYTTDGGESWNKLPLRQPVWCRRYRDSIGCVTGENTFSTLRITRNDKP